MENLDEQIELQRQKIARVIYDIDKFRQEGRADRKVETLEQYKEWLEEELMDMQRRKDAGQS